MGISQFQFIQYYLEQTKDLNRAIENLKVSFVDAGAGSDIFLQRRDRYLDLLRYSNAEKLNTKFHYQLDTSCILDILRVHFHYIKDSRMETNGCSNDSLNRLYYFFGYYPKDTPEWLHPKFKEALKERGIDAWWVNNDYK